jgi:hypothetical protein
MLLSAFAMLASIYEVHIISFSIGMAETRQLNRKRV